MSTDKHAELVKTYPDCEPFLLKKWERVFNAFFDRNAGGSVDWNDFYLVVRQVRDIYGADSTQMTLAKKSLKGLWEGLLKMADKDDNKLISLDEWVVALRKSATDTKAEHKWFDDYVSMMFQLFDVSEDKMLDICEYADGMKAYGFTEADAQDAFKKFTTKIKQKTGNPCIDFPTFQKYWKEYFYSRDPLSPGNWLFGSFPELESAAAAAPKK